MDVHFFGFRFVVMDVKIRRLFVMDVRWLRLRFRPIVVDFV